MSTFNESAMFTMAYANTFRIPGNYNVFDLEIFSWGVTSHQNGVNL